MALGLELVLSLEKRGMEMGGRGKWRGCLGALGAQLYRRKGQRRRYAW